MSNPAEKASSTTPEKPKAKKSLGAMFKDLIESWKKGDSKETWATAIALIGAIFSKRLGSLKDEVEKTKKETEAQKKKEAEAKKETRKETKAESKKEPEKKESDETPEAKKKKPVPELPPGELFSAIQQVFPEAEVEPQLIPQKTVVSKPRKGALGWKMDTTDDWDYSAAENNEKDMNEGLYRIEGVGKVPGYSREVKGKVPNATARKLTRVAIALRRDPRMPLFTGIPVTVDGIKVMFVKEIHMHPKGTASNYLCQPHTGVSYLIAEDQQVPVA